MSRSTWAYTQRLRCFSHERENNFADVDEVLVRWRPWVPPDSDDDADDMDALKPGLERAVSLRLAVGPPCEGRRRVSVSAWTAPTTMDFVDMTEVGMLIDENNDAVLTPGERVVLKLRSVRARCCTSAGCSKRLNCPLVLFVEYAPHDTSRIDYLFVPGEDVARITVAEMATCYVANLAAANAVKEGYAPDAPPPRPKPQATVEDACAAAAERRAAKRARSGLEMPEFVDPGAVSDDAADHDPE